jgi:cyclopropane-fatty-acyl-phospholipid synthase
MKKNHLKDYTLELLNYAGIHLNGDKPWDIQIYNEDFYGRVLKYGSLGLGEAYMDSWWDCKSLDQFFDRIIQADIESKVKSNIGMLLRFALLKIINYQTKRRSLIVGKKHYDLGNDLFQAMLDKRMNYTCGYWKNATNLNDAQQDKLELTCQKMMLKPGMKILDIGCGFGALAKYAVEKYDVNVVGVTISKEQCEFAQKNCANMPIQILFQDYRDIQGHFDRIVSLGMFEHVGQKNYLAYMQKVYQCLNDDGLFLLHTIGNNITNPSVDPWVTKYIFPNGSLPSIMQIGKATEKLFIMEDWHNFGADYNKTLMAWYANFTQHWSELKNQYDDRFYRMWSYYLLSCASTFRLRQTQLWQIVFSKHGIKEGYQAPRL